MSEFQQQQQQRQPSKLVQEKAYGSWKSPISSELATAASVGLCELHLDRAPRHQDVVYWTEARYSEGGRYVVCANKPGKSEPEECTPDNLSARTRVHEYGGGATFVHDGKVYFSNFEDQRMYVRNLKDGSAAVAITPECKWRYADGMFSAKQNLIYCVREDHTNVKKLKSEDSGKKEQAVNTLVVINPETQQQTLLVSGCDFYASPKVSSDGKKFCWMQWNHPNMPWNETEVWVAELAESGDAFVDGSPKKIASGASVMQPTWAPNNELLYISDLSNWWNLYHVTSSGEHVNLRPVDAEIGGPQWNFACYAYDCDPSDSGKIATSFAQKLGLLDMRTKEYKEFDTGYTSHHEVQFAANGFIYCIADSPSKYSAVIKVNSSNGKVEVVRPAGELTVGPEYLSEPIEKCWSTEDGEKSYGYFYSPKNADFWGLPGSLPPLLVKVHGGPTASCSSALSMTTQYFTSRGFALLDVNYRGSTGYGKKYRDRLNTNWGVLDVIDCSNGALYLAETGQVDGAKLCIDGGSAGGYTTLACLAFRKDFKAGASYYGIGDVAILAAETHKFESRYVDGLIAPATPENIEGVYKDRSPIEHMDKFNCPIAFFQGDQDEVVPPNQSEMMFNEVKNKGLPCAFLLFKGEGHGFVKAENKQKALDGEFYFYSQMFGFQPADEGIEIDIENLPKDSKQ